MRIWLGKWFAKSRGLGQFGWARGSREFMKFGQFRGFGGFGRSGQDTQKN